MVCYSTVSTVSLEMEDAQQSVGTPRPTYDASPEGQKEADWNATVTWLGFFQDWLDVFSNGSDVFA